MRFSAFPGAGLSVRGWGLAVVPPGEDSSHNEWQDGRGDDI